MNTHITYNSLENSCVGSTEPTPRDIRYYLHSFDSKFRVGNNDILL